MHDLQGREHYLSDISKKKLLTLACFWMLINPISFRLGVIDMAKLQFETSFKDRDLHNYAIILLSSGTK